MAANGGVAMVGGATKEHHKSKTLSFLRISLQSS
jgi:hypothetical protein